MDEPAANRSSPSGILASLNAIGIATALVYLFTLIFYFRGPDEIGKTPKQVFAILSVTALLFLYWRGYKAVSSADTRDTLRTILIFAAVFALITLLTYPFHSTDVFGYINRGWQQVRYGQNPYVYTLAEVPDWQNDPMLTEHWLYNPNPYGFLFTILANGVCRLGMGSWWFTLGLFKLLNVGAYAAIAAIIWKASHKLGRTRPHVALYVFLWSPLVLMHCIANGHNDILTGVCILLAMYFAVTSAWFWIIPMLAAASMLKYAPGVLIPFAFVYVWKNGNWRTAITSSVVGVLLIAAVSYPYLIDWREIRWTDIQVNATLIDNSLHSLIIHIFNNVAKVVGPLKPYLPSIDYAIKTLLRISFLAFVAWQFFTIPKQFSAQELIRRSTAILLFLFCIATSKFNAWYMAMILPVALLLAERDILMRLTSVISASELLSLTFFKQAYMINYFVEVLVPGWWVIRDKGRVDE